MLTMQSFMHIASVTGVLPLTGVPLPYEPWRDIAYDLLAVLGIVLQISKFSEEADQPRAE